MKAQICGHADRVVRQQQAVARQSVGINAIRFPKLAVNILVDFQTATDQETLQFNAVNGLFVPGIVQQQQPPSQQPPSELAVPHPGNGPK